MLEPRKPFLIGLKDMAARMSRLQLFVEEASALAGTDLKARRDPRFVTAQLTDAEVERFRKKYGDALLFEPDAPLKF